MASISEKYILSIEKGIKSMHYHIHVSRYYKQEVCFMLVLQICFAVFIYLRLETFVFCLQN